MLELLRDICLVPPKMPTETFGPYRDGLSKAFGWGQMSADQ